MKQELIANYITQLSSLGDQRLEIPVEFEKDFWDWFERKSRIYESKSIRKNLYSTSIPIIENNFCFKNTYRIAKGFVKRLFYFEGFFYQKSNDQYIRHAFNVCKHDTVFDYSMKNKTNKNNIYLGVKIPLTFARKIYKFSGDFKFTQYSLLASYYLFSVEYEESFQYTDL